MSRRGVIAAVSLLVLLGPPAIAWLAPLPNWSPLPVEDDPLVRMPGTQPGEVSLEGPDRCLNCHANLDDPIAEPVFHWQGSMMAQAARDFLFWSAVTVAAQDSIWAIGRPNATDLCLRCHFPEGWLEGRSDPTNATLMVDSDYDGVHCDFCHKLYDPFFETTYQGTREGNDWLSYWDETNLSGTPSQPAADTTWADDQVQAAEVEMFNGEDFFHNGEPFSPSYAENGGGQYFVSDGSELRGPFADAAARHQMDYSRYHKSRYFCSSCHDVSNPALANLAFEGTPPGDGTTVLPSEEFSAHSYFHLERTFSEFMLSDYGLPAGAPGSGAYAPDVFDTSHPDNWIARCQDCHLHDVDGVACNKNGSVDRPDGSIEHPLSGAPSHQLAGGNMWVPQVLASAVPGSPNYDPVNDQLLNQGPGTLTLDLGAGLGVNPVALLAGADNCRRNLEAAASVEGLTYDPGTGALAFRVQNHTGHKLISGFPEGRRMFLNVRAWTGGVLVHEINPYDADAGTLKGLDHPSSPPLDPGEEYLGELVYEVHLQSDLTGEEATQHMVLSTGRSKDNRIPPRGFRIDEATQRICEPVWHGDSAPDYFTAAEYAGGYDEVQVDLPPGADRVEVLLYYQTTSREFVEFLRDEINGTVMTLPPEAYIAQTDPWFAQLRAWGDTLWSLWQHNKDLPGAAPVLMAQAAVVESSVTIASLETGRMVDGRFSPATQFSRGETVVARARLLDAATGVAVEGASVHLDWLEPVNGIGGLDGTFQGEEGRWTAESSARGYVYAQLKTRAPGTPRPGTPPGPWEVLADGVSAPGLAWDGMEVRAAFQLD